MESDGTELHFILLLKGKNNIFILEASIISSGFADVMPTGTMASGSLYLNRESRFLIILISVIICIVVKSLLFKLKGYLI